MSKVRTKLPLVALGLVLAAAAAVSNVGAAPKAAEGACCLPTGACIVTTPAGCDAQSGLYIADNQSCDARTCDPPSGAELVTWGKIKSRYRG